MLGSGFKPAVERCPRLAGGIRKAENVSIVSAALHSRLITDHMIMASDGIFAPCPGLLPVAQRPVSQELSAGR